MTQKEEHISEEAKQRAKNYMSLKGALEPKQIKCYCGHTTYCDCSTIETTPNKTNMKQIDKIRICFSLTMVACGVIIIIIGEPLEKALSIVPFLMALYPLSKIGFEDRY